MPGHQVVARRDHIRLLLGRALDLGHQGKLFVEPAAARPAPAGPAGATPPVPTNGHAHADVTNGTADREPAPKRPRRARRPATDAGPELSAAAGATGE